MLKQPSVFLIWLLLGGLALGGCAKPIPGPAVNPSPPPVRIGLSGDYPPFCKLGQGPQSLQGYTGFDVELLRRLADDLGWRELQPVRYAWPGLAEFMIQGKADLAACGITVRRDRAPAMLFSRPYALSGAVAVIRPGAAARFKDIAALDRPPVRLAVNAGGHLEKVARERFKKARIHTVTDNRALRDELDKGAADVVISDTFEASRWPDLTVLGPFTRDLKALALPLGQRERRDAINVWLAAREADGWLPDQRRKLGVQEAETGPAGFCAESLVSAIELRFSLMPLVAAVKRREGLPVTDPAQEASVLGRAEAMAAREDLSAEAAAELFRWLIDAAKRIQRQSHVTADPHLTLAGLRAAVAGTSDMLLPEIKRCRGVLEGHAEILNAVLRNRLGGWLEQAQIDALRDRLPPRRDYSRKP